MSHPCQSDEIIDRRGRSSSPSRAARLLIPALLLSSIGGLLLAACGLTLPLPLLWPLLLALAWFLLRSPRLALLAAMACCALLAGARYQLQLHPALPSQHVAHLPRNRPLTIEGRVAAVHGGNQVLRLDLDAQHLVHDSQLSPLRGRLRLTIGQGDIDLQPGQRIRFRGRLRSPELFATPGEFDYPRYLAARNIFVTAYLNDAEALIVFGGTDKGGCLAKVIAARNAIGRHIDKAVPPPQAPLVRALVIGDRNLPTDQRRRLAESGLSHLFAISGLHLGMVALLLYTLGQQLYRRSERLLLLMPPGRLLPILLLPPLWLYLHLTGNALSTRRALLMTAIGALLLVCGRRTKPLHALAAVALLMLCAEPLVFFEPAMQLSMIGVGGILLVLPRWQRRIAVLPPLWRWPVGLAATTLAATLATTPLVLYHFHLLAPAALLNNMLAVPLIGFGAVPLGLGGALLDTLWPTGGALLYRLCGQICHFTLLGATQLSNWPPLAGRTFYLPPETLTGITLLVLVLLIPLPVNRWRHLRWLLFAAAGLLLFWPPQIPQSLTITDLSVGQGEALLLSRPQTGYYLIDGGGFYGSNFDVGARLVAPALGRLGVRSLEAVVLSHNHPDHSQGLAEILEHFPVKAFWSALPLEKLPAELRAPLARHAIPLRTFAAGWTEIDNGSSEGLAVYVPSLQTFDANDRSLVVYVRHRRDGVLLTGDLERRGVDDLLAHTPDGPVTLLKLPHHGSRHSEPWHLVDRFLPQLVFASSGRHNTYGLPHREVVDYLATRNLHLHDTGRDGTLRFQSDGRGWSLQCWQKGLFR